jgi:hypothetical protein
MAPDGNLQADIVICSHVIHPIRDIEPFLLKLKMLHSGLHLCSGYSYRCLTAEILAAFHHLQRCLPPSHTCTDVLYEMHIHECGDSFSFKSEITSLDVAVTVMTEQPILTEMRKLV